MPHHFWKPCKTQTNTRTYLLTSSHTHAETPCRIASTVLPAPYQERLHVRHPLARLRVELDDPVGSVGGEAEGALMKHVVPDLGEWVQELPCSAVPY
jgi:hypothetical protein